MTQFWKNSLTHYEGRIHGCRKHFEFQPDGYAEFAAFETSLCLLRLKHLPDQFDKIKKEIDQELDVLLLQDRACLNEMLRLMRANKWRKSIPECSNHLQLMAKHLQEVHGLLQKTIELM